jgi:hypothetical protein
MGQVLDISITEIDPDLDLVTGIAEPFSELLVIVNWTDESYYFTMADSEGVWTADYSGNFDIGFGDLVSVQQDDEYGSLTYFQRLVVSPDGLVNEILNLPEEAVSPEIKNSLVKKIENAYSSFLKGNLKAAQSKLEALRNEIDALEGNKISPETAEWLRRLVWHLISSFE